MKEDIVPKLQCEETDTHPRLINSNTNLVKKLNCGLNLTKSVLTFQFLLYLTAEKGRKKQKHINAVPLLWLTIDD